MVEGIRVEFYGPFESTNVDYSSDVVRYLMQLHGGYEHARFILYWGDPSAYIVSPWSYNGGTNQGFALSNSTYNSPLDWLMDAYTLGYRKYSRYNCSAFHEWAHAWNAIVLRSFTSVGKWYHDGIANYYEAIGPRDIWGLEEAYQAQLYQAWQYYRANLGSPIDKPLYQLTPFQDDTFSNETALMIYSKGMLFYHMLDNEFELRGKDFSDFVTLIYDTFNSENPGTVEDFIDLASEFAGEDLSAFMESYLLGNVEYPLAELDSFKSSYGTLFGNAGRPGPSSEAALSLTPDPLYAGQPTLVTVIVEDASYVREDQTLLLFVRPYGSNPQDVADRQAPELRQFVPDPRVWGSFYKDGVAYVGIDLPLRRQEDMWTGELVVVPVVGMALSVRNAADTAGCVIDQSVVSGTPPPDYPLAD